MGNKVACLQAFAKPDCNVHTYFLRLAHTLQFGLLMQFDSTVLFFITGSPTIAEQQATVFKRDTPGPMEHLSTLWAMRFLRVLKTWNFPLH